MDSFNLDNLSFGESCSEGLVVHIIVLEVGCDTWHPKPMDVLQKGIDVLFLPRSVLPVMHVVYVPAILQSENDALKLAHKIIE